MSVFVFLSNLNLFTLVVFLIIALIMRYVSLYSYVVPSAPVQILAEGSVSFVAGLIGENTAAKHKILHVFVPYGYVILGAVILAENNQLYNVLVTAHAPLMVFFMAMPVLTRVFGNGFMPTFVGASKMAFPRLNKLCFWFFGIISYTVPALISKLVFGYSDKACTFLIRAFGVMVICWQLLGFVPFYSFSVPSLSPHKLGLGILSMKRGTVEKGFSIKRIFKSSLSSFNSWNKKTTPPKVGRIFYDNIEGCLDRTAKVAGKLRDEGVRLATHPEVMAAKTPGEIFEISSNLAKVDLFRNGGFLVPFGSGANGPQMAGEPGVPRAQEILSEVRDMTCLTLASSHLALEASGIKVWPCGNSDLLNGNITSLNDIQKVCEFSSLITNLIVFNSIITERGGAPCKYILPSNKDNFSNRDSIVCSLEDNPFSLYFDNTTSRQMWGGRSSRKLDNSNGPTPNFKSIYDKMCVTKDLPPEEQVGQIMSSLSRLATKYGRYNQNFAADIESIKNLYPKEDTHTSVELLRTQDKVFLNNSCLTADERNLIVSGFKKYTKSMEDIHGPSPKSWVIGMPELLNKSDADWLQVIAELHRSRMLDPNHHKTQSLEKDLTERSHDWIKNMGSNPDDYKMADILEGLVELGDSWTKPTDPSLDKIPPFFKNE